MAQVQGIIGLWTREEGPSARTARGLAPADNGGTGQGSVSLPKPGVRQRRRRQGCPALPQTACTAPAAPGPEHEALHASDGKRGDAASRCRAAPLKASPRGAGGRQSALRTWRGPSGASGARRAPAPGRSRHCFACSLCLAVPQTRAAGRPGGGPTSTRSDAGPHCPGRRSGQPRGASCWPAVRLHQHRGRKTSALSPSPRCLSKLGSPLESPGQCPDSLVPPVRRNQGLRTLGLGPVTTCTARPVTALRPMPSKRPAHDHEGEQRAGAPAGTAQ